MTDRTTKILELINDSDVQSSQLGLSMLQQAGTTSVLEILRSNIPAKRKIFIITRKEILPNNLRRHLVQAWATAARRPMKITFEEVSPEAPKRKLFRGELLKIAIKELGNWM